MTVSDEQITEPIITDKVNIEEEKKQKTKQMKLEDEPDSKEYKTDKVKEEETKKTETKQKAPVKVQKPQKTLVEEPDSKKPDAKIEEKQSKTSQKDTILPNKDDSILEPEEVTFQRPINC